MRTLDIQRALPARGFDVGKDGADGGLSAGTTKAIKAFQIANGLSPIGKFGPLTEAILFPKTVPARDDLPTFQPAAVDANERPPATRWPRQRDCMTFFGGVG